MLEREQVRGRDIDHRSDIFSFGAILYEMATGKRAFHRDSTADTMSAILKEDPVDPSSTNKSVPAALERIIRHCLEKNAEERFQSARDLAFDLEMMSGTSGTSVTNQAVAVSESKRSKASRVLLPMLFIAGILLGAGATYLLLQSSTSSIPAEYQRLTFGRGFLNNARFAPDHQTVIYSGNWSGAESDLFSTRPQAPVSRVLNLPKAHLLSISSTSEMAILMDAVYTTGWMRNGTLARVPIDGGGPRAVLDNVQDADWSPDGSQLAVVRNTPLKHRVEYPIGKVIYETDGWLSNIRISRDGRMIALMEHPTLGDDRGMVIVIDLEGKKKILTNEWASESGLAWSPKGDEIWFSASQGGSNLSPLRAVTMEGKQRRVTAMAGNLLLVDVSPDGQVLIAEDNRRREMIGLGPGETKEHDLSWMDWSFPRDISADGKLVLFEEEGAGGGQNYSVCLRGTDGSPAVRLGDGYAIALSPDHQIALAALPSTSDEIYLLPTGAGQSKRIKSDFSTKQFFSAQWMPDSKTILLRAASKGDSQPRAWLYEIETGKSKAVTPEGVTNAILSSDGKFVLANCVDEGRCVYELQDGTVKKVTGLATTDFVINAASDPQSFYVASGGGLVRKIDVVNIFTGERKPWKEITPPDIAGVVAPINVRITPDGSAYVYTYRRVLTDLYLAKGLH